MGDYFLLTKRGHIDGYVLNARWLFVLIYLYRVLTITKLTRPTRIEIEPRRKYLFSISVYL
jgi:hypothetical protein